jgi:pyruvate dehydrogenase E1 component
LGGKLPIPLWTEAHADPHDRHVTATQADRSALQTLAAIEDKVLWLSTSIVHHANKVRSTPSGVKVGGHQASSASMVSIMTALWFEHLRAPDRVSVKPHASPVLHAIEYLLGLLDERYLTTLREFGGLQSYPSRLKDPVSADFSTGSVGIGATAPIWSAVAHRYVAGHFEVPQGGRRVALLGDAELDEGAIWETIVDPLVSHLGEVLWIVDLNRQSLDRVVPDIAADRLTGMFEAAGWQTITVKYGRRLRELFERDGGGALRRRIDAMPNEEYQRLLRSSAAELRDRLPGSGRGSKDVARLIATLADDELRLAISDLGGHDLGDLLDAYARADQVTDRPSVVFAYTIKAWRLATQGHPANHSALLSTEQWHKLATETGADPADPWSPFAEGSAEAELCSAVAKRLAREETTLSCAPRPPAELGRRHAGRASTQQAFGRFFVDLSNTAPDVASHVVTVSPDVASSTNLGAGSTTSGSGIWVSASTGLPTIPTPWSDGVSQSTAGTSSLASPRATSWGCWESSGRRGLATARRCCRSGRCSPGRSVSTRGVSRSWSARPRVSRSRPREARINRSSPRRSASSSLAASPGSPRLARTSSGRCCTPSRSSASLEEPLRTSA